VDLRAYSANPDGVMAYLEYMNLFSGKKVIIMPCLIELGKSSKEIHKEIGKKIAQVNGLAIITTRDRFNEIKTGATGVGMKGDSIVSMENPKKIKNLLKDYVSNSDTVLLAGRLPQGIIDAIKKN
jgi:UDP-N-acetylmuramoyl-tripeptide--D-alanyl-D-alanine ligase